MTTTSHPLVDRLFALWTAAPDAAAFAELYADPVLLNGVETPVADLVERAGSLRRTFAGLDREVLEVLAAGDKVVVVFRMTGRHEGTYRSPLGNIAPTHRRIEVRTIDVLTVAEGRITAVWVAADELGLLAALCAD